MDVKLCVVLMVLYLQLQAVFALCDFSICCGVVDVAFAAEMASLANIYIYICICVDAHSCSGQLIRSLLACCVLLSPACSRNGGYFGLRYAELR